ncbi:hypothetical protein QEH42_gp180 [Microbacterium phage Pumpernickel]|uniref:Uncharacterized protein n=1 Tax=Microbacterium phage Pumpernickel TaxID=2885983 RepID=A0AAE9C2L6_9CAUD|nr:hypothetical protein QEH42_gp180 [Microbacterium phage Pumpernickel]UDL16038.1 hypothetical protein SEA_PUMPERNICKEL_288 [Microbacterium phage Pumpernickel]
MTLPIVYRAKRLSELIVVLEALGDELVSGLEPVIQSYRGYYDRPSIEPSSPTMTYQASHLAKVYTDYIGKTMYGYKGGEYEIKADSWVHLATWGSTGHYILGLQKTSEGIYIPVLLTEDYL